MIKKYGFKINKIIMFGLNKKEVYLEFDLGLNVISGASDTGKTFIFQALDYMFGGNIKPKEIEEAQGYDEIYLEIEDFEENIYTLKRNITDGKMFLYQCRYELKDTVATINIKEEHNKFDEKNISTFLLNLCGSKYKNVVKNLDGKTKSFSYRDFVRITALNEEKIISEKSIVLGSAGKVVYTSNKNAFKTIITGLEDKGLSSKDEKKINNIKIDAQIDMVDKLIKSYNEELKNLLNYNFEKDVNKIEILIKDIEKVVNSKKENLKEADERRQSLIRKSSEYYNKIAYNNELIKKFSLLKKNYLSDLKRIEFIDDANYYINQLDDVKCPICYSNIEEVSIDIESISEGVHVEKNKLKKKVIDIDEAIIELEVKKTKFIEANENIIEEVDKLTNKMNLELRPLIDLKVDKLRDLLNKRDEINKIDFIESKLIEIKELRDKLFENKKSVNNVKVEVKKINDTTIRDLSSEVSRLLNEWKLFDNPNVSFDLKSYDLIINNKKKSSFGKGYRAIINSAFAIAIMRYNISRGLPHPKVIILDSPLITFKDKDSGKENISDVVKTLFYNYLAKNFKNQQIIVLENADPDKDLCSNIKYYHFTKNRDYGRYGFFPI